MIAPLSTADFKIVLNLILSMLNQNAAHADESAGASLNVEVIYSIKPSTEVGQATVPADTCRHGGRPYDSTRSEFLFRIDWLFSWP